MIVASPRVTLSVKNSASNDAPTTTDGAAMSTNTTDSTAVRPKKRWRARAIAIGTPIRIEISVEAQATSIECTSAVVRSLMSKMCRYHWVVEPYQWKVTRPFGVWLKLKMIITMIGMSV